AAAAERSGVPQPSFTPALPVRATPATQLDARADTRPFAVSHLTATSRRPRALDPSERARLCRALRVGCAGTMRLPCARRAGRNAGRWLEMERFVWWKHGVVYQIYPRSFMDADRDGVGDLRGIERRLDHLAWLGVDALWLSPCFRSPMADFGYDVSDYCDIDPIFGSLADFDALLAAAHARGIRVVLDWVPNHTSDQHPWFLESRASRASAKRDWYVWRDPRPDGSPPNQWRSVFGGSAWEWDAATGQFFLHSFLREQPELDWRNPEVVKAMHGTLRFWLDRGVDEI